MLCPKRPPQPRDPAQSHRVADASPGAARGRTPSTTSLDPPGAEMRNLVGCDEPQHDILEEPQEHLAVDGRERRPLPRGGKSLPTWQASSAGAPESSRPA